MVEQHQKIILQSSSVRQVTYQGAGMYMFQLQPDRKPLSKKEQQERDSAFKKRLEEAMKQIEMEEKLGGDAA